MKNRTSTNRRDFLLAAGLGTVGVAAAVVETGQIPLAKPRADAPAESPSGYRATKHILKYYKTTEV